MDLCPFRISWKKYPNNNIITNDINDYVINFYNVLKTNKIELLLKIKKINTLDNINNYKTLLNKINNGIKDNVVKIINCILQENYKNILNIDENKFDTFSDFLNK